MHVTTSPTTCKNNPAAVQTGRIVAAPSCIWPAGVLENCRRLAALPPELAVDETVLCLFETAACLAYTRDDLPAQLEDLPLSFHAHLPVDLPWSQGAEAVAQALRGLVDMTLRLRPCRAFVLHPPPPELAALLPAAARAFREAGADPGCVHVENIPGNDLVASWPAIAEAGFGVCVDLGHLLAFGQQALLELPGLAARLGMLHLHAPGRDGDGWKDSHGPLQNLDAQGRETMARLLAMLPPGGTVVLEHFQPDVFLASRAQWSHIHENGQAEGLDG